jgi:hypothetical protein
LGFINGLIFLIFLGSEFPCLLPPFLNDWVGILPPDFLFLDLLLVMIGNVEVAFPFAGGCILRKKRCPVVFVGHRTPAGGDVYGFHQVLCLPLHRTAEIIRSGDMTIIVVVTVVKLVVGEGDRMVGWQIEGGG